MYELQDILDHLKTGRPIPPLVMEERPHPEFPGYKIVQEQQCRTILPDGTRCDGVDQTLKKITLSDKDAFDYESIVPCVKCDVPRMISKCFGFLDSRQDHARSIENGILAGLKTKPQRNKYNEAAMETFKRLLKTKDCKESVMLLGPVGTGKTFLAQHFLKAMITKQRRQCMYAQEYTILHAWRFSQDKGKNTGIWGHQFLHKCRTADYLLLDDFGAARRTSDGALDELERLIMGRCEASMPVIITTNLSPEDIEMRRGTRVWSRLKGMAKENVFVIKGGDFRQKVEWEV